MSPYFSLITPTLQRDSLIQCCESIDAQTFRGGIQHIVQVDSPDLDVALMNRIDKPYREIYCCGVHHANGGNTCRREALEMATGVYVYFIDDDNVFFDSTVLDDVALALESSQRPSWGLFPIWRLGGVFFADPPRSCHVDTMNVVLRRDIAYWPDTDAYGTDGILVDDLMERKVPYVPFPNFRPIGVITKISFGK